MNCCNGESYLDVTIEKDKVYQHIVTIDQDVLTDKNHIYAVASPIYENDTTGMWYLEKTPSKLVMKQGT